MITDARALQPEYTPRELFHRDGEIDQLSAVLAPVAQGIRAEDACLFGPSGTGKTTLAKYTAAQLEPYGISWGYVNCMSDSGHSAVLHQLLRSAGYGHDLRREGTPADVFVNRFRDIEEQFVAIVDEVTFIAEEKTLLTLQELPGVSLLTVCIDEDDFFATLDNRVRSRLQSAETISLDRYTHTEMVDIIDGRVEAGLRSGVVGPGVVETIADLAAGNAQTAIAILRRAVRHAMDDDYDEITVPLVEDVTDGAREDIRDQRVRTLGTHKRLLFEIIDEAGEIKASEVRDRYKRDAQNPKTDRQRRRYLKSLERYGLIESYGKTRGKRYRVSPIQR